MATQTEQHQIPHESERFEASDDIHTDRFQGDSHADIAGGAEDAILTGRELTQASEQKTEGASAPSPRRLGRILMRPFMRGSDNVPVKVLAERTIAEEQGSGETIYDIRYKEIMESPLIQEIPESERAEAVSQTIELYKAAKEVVAPVIVGFADYLLEDADGRQIVFAARDGLGAFTAATKLKEKFDYGNSDPDQLIYAYLTRKVVLGTPRNTVGKYLRQLGVRDTDDELILADIGMFGTMFSTLQDIMPKVDVRYLISKTPEIPGYADGRESHMTSVRSVVGNPAIHFMEDTFSGVIPSPGSLQERNGQLVPDTLDAGFPPAEALKRQFALKAIEDYAIGLESRPDQPPVEAVKRLDEFLRNPAQFKHLMVPHHS